MIKAILIFFIFSLINVMLNTVKTIIMYRNEKFSSSLINAITYGFYCVVVVLIAGEMALWLKIVLTAISNFIGVWVSMVILDKLRKDKLWEVRATIRADDTRIDDELAAVSLAFTSILTTDGKHCVYNIYCPTQKDSMTAKQILTRHNAKYFVSESKSL